MFGQIQSVAPSRHDLSICVSYFSDGIPLQRSCSLRKGKGHRYRHRNFLFSPCRDWSVLYKKWDDWRTERRTSKAQALAVHLLRSHDWTDEVCDGICWGPQKGKATENIAFSLHFSRFSSVFYFSSADGDGQEYGDSVQTSKRRETIGILCVGCDVTRIIPCVRNTV